MALQSKRWQVAPPVGEAQLARFPDLSPLIIQLLHNRELTEPGAVHDFMAGGSIGDNPFQMKGVGQAVGRLSEAIRAGERIAVYGDFDADGVTATTLLANALGALGADVVAYIPDRVKEGYGLNLDALRRLYRQKVRVVVTVDCGIRAIEQVSQASKGLDMIITDHHTPLEELPPALAVINPKQPGCPYPFKLLAGVGVAYKLAQGLIRRRVQMGPPLDFSEESLLDLVALGTVADLVPLVSENRALVRQGLKALNKPARPGIAALMANANLRRGDVDATAIGFRLGPRLNAAGRVDSAMLAYSLLSSLDPLETKERAAKLGVLNSRRQELTEQTVAAAEAQVQAGQPDAYLHLAASPDFVSGVVGLAASRLTEAYYRPSVVVQMGEGHSRGSCRSIPEFDITAALDQCQDILVRHGGHAAAAGFTVATPRLDDLRRRLQEIAAEQLSSVDLRPTLEIDAEYPMESLDSATNDLLRTIEPCGMGNPKPLLVSRNVTVRSRKTVGKEGQHLKLNLLDEKNVTWDAIAFRKGDVLNELPGKVDVAYNLEVNEWNHQKRLQLVVRDLKAAGSDE